MAFEINNSIIPYEVKIRQGATHVVILLTKMDFVRLLIMKNARSFATNHGETCMINVLRGYARSYVTNKGDLIEGKRKRAIR